MPIERTNFNMKDPIHQNKNIQMEPGSDKWLGGPVEVETKKEIHDDPSSLVSPLAPGEGFDGLKYKAYIPHKNSKETPKDEVITKIKAIPEHLVKTAGIVLHVLTDSIFRGVRGGWDNKKNIPDERFIEIEGADLEKAVKKLATKWNEDCMVYDILRSEPMPNLTNQEIAIKAALLKRASRSCSH